MVIRDNEGSKAIGVKEAGGGDFRKRNRNSKTDGTQRATGIHPWRFRYSQAETCGSGSRSHQDGASRSSAKRGWEVYFLERFGHTSLPPLRGVTLPGD